MRLRGIEEKLQVLIERRWGSDAMVRVELDDDSGRVRMMLPDGLELIGHVPDQGPLLPGVSRLLEEYLEQIDPWIADDRPPSLGVAE